MTITENSTRAVATIDEHGRTNLRRPGGGAVKGGRWGDDLSLGSSVEIDVPDMSCGSIVTRQGRVAEIGSTIHTGLQGAANYVHVWVEVVS